MIRFPNLPIPYLNKNSPFIGIPPFNTIQCFNRLTREGVYRVGRLCKGAQGRVVSPRRYYVASFRRESIWQIGQSLRGQNFSSDREDRVATERSTEEGGRGWQGSETV